MSALAASNLIQLPDIIQHQFAVLFIQLCVLSDLVADVGESSLPASFRQLLIQLLQSSFDEAVYPSLQRSEDCNMSKGRLAELLIRICAKRRRCSRSSA